MTQRNQTNQDASDARDWALSPQQAAAVDLLASGKTITDTAAAIGVGRPTCSGWLHNHLGFQVALNRRRQELWHELTDTLCGMVPKALQVLQDALDGDQKVRVAEVVLRASGLYGLVVPAGPTEIEEAVLEAEERQGDRTRRTQDALLKSMSIMDQIEHERVWNERLG